MFRAGVIGGLFARTLAWLVPALALWYWAREAVVAPVAWLARVTMLNCFPDWVLGVRLDGTTAVLLTLLQVPAGGGALRDLTPEVAVLPYCYGLPLFAALLLASRARALWWKLPLGALVLWPLLAWGLCFNWLVAIAVYAAEVTRATTGFTPLQGNLFALGFQFGYLLLPSVTPLLLWLYLERRYVTTVVVDGAMAGALDISQAPSQPRMPCGRG